MIAALIATSNVAIGIAVACAPIVILLLLAILRNPYYGYTTLFFANYFIIAIIRYTNIDGLSILIDSLIALTIASFFIQLIFIDRKQKSKIFNTLTLLAFIWLIYCSLELVNPRALTSAWIQSRGTTYYLLAMSIATFVTFKEFKMVNTILMILSVLTLVGVAKALMQKYIGFDWAEMRDLNEGLAKTHLLGSGTRYFSIYASAGIFGVVMGHAVVVYGILSIYTKSKAKKLYYLFVALVSFYAMLISGTRGAIIVPVGGLIMFIILSKQLKIIIPTSILLISAYMFLAMTKIGQSNYEIRRMRTALDPNEPSLVVRFNNQKLLKEYLADKPFGEGLGLSGVDAKNVSDRFTTSIPTDSWYVKIWVETGIVGLCTYLAILAYIIIYGAYTIMFRIRDPEIQSVLTALLCGVFGIILSSYGNQVLGQFPVVLISFTSIALIFMGKYFDNQKHPQHTKS